MTLAESLVRQKNEILARFKEELKKVMAENDRLALKKLEERQKAFKRKTD